MMSQQLQIGCRTPCHHKLPPLWSSSAVPSCLDLKHELCTARLFCRFHLDGHTNRAHRGWRWPLKSSNCCCMFPQDLCCEGRSLRTIQKASATSAPSLQHWPHLLNMHIIVQLKGQYNQKSCIIYSLSSSHSKAVWFFSSEHKKYFEERW